MPNNIHEYCRNCMEDITSEPIMVEEERNIKGYEGEVEKDVPIIIYFCSETCRKEYFKPINLDL